MTDGAELIGAGGCARIQVGSAEELAEAARRLVLTQTGTLTGELIVHIHESGLGRLGLPERLPRDETPAFLAGARSLGAVWVVDGDPRVQISVPAYSRDFAGAADPGELFAALELFHATVGMHYSASAGTTALHLVGNTANVPETGPPPPLDPPYVQPAHSIRDFRWMRAPAPEDPAEWVRAFDRNASYLAAWRSCYFGDGDWLEVNDHPPVGAETRESDLACGYWLIDEPTRAAVAAATARRGLPDPIARRNAADGPTWLTTPLLRLTAEILADGAQRQAVPIEQAWLRPHRSRFLDTAAQRMAAARDQLRADPHPAARLVLGVLKDMYSAGTSNFQRREPPHPMARPDWRHTILDRAVANTYRALARTEPRPLAWYGIDTLLFPLHRPDDVPAGLKLDTGIGSWKPLGQPVPLADVLAATDGESRRGALDKLFAG